MRAAVFVVILFFCASAASGDTSGNVPVTVTASVQKPSFNIGEKIRYSIEVRRPKDVEVRFPDIGGDTGGLILKDSGSSESGLFNTRTHIRWYLLESFEAGEYIIPPAVVQYRSDDSDDWQDAAVPEVKLEILSMLGSETAESGIKDIRGPVDLKNYLLLYLLAALMFILIIVAVVIYLRKKRKRPVEPVIPVRPADEIALEALEGLLKKDLVRGGRIHEYYTELSGIVRHYIEGRFYLRAPEMTTEEFLSGLKRTDSLNAEHKGLLRTFLSDCDRVKFAKYRPEEDEMSASYDSARGFVEQTRLKD